MCFCMQIYLPILFRISEREKAGAENNDCMYYPVFLSLHLFFSSPHRLKLAIVGGVFIFLTPFHSTGWSFNKVLKMLTLQF